MNKKELKNQYKLLKTEMGIFAFKCKFDSKYYLGYSQNTKADINSITFQLNLGNYSINTNLQKDWNNYGAENFEITVLEALDYDKDAEKTDYTIDLQALREVVAEKLNNYENIN